MTQDLLALVDRAQRRDPDAFATLIERFERTALSVAYAQIQDGHRAADAVQEAFLRAWQELPRLQEPVRFAGWLMQIVRNAAIDMRRRLKPTTPDFPDLVAGVTSPAQALEAADRARQIEAALASLDEVSRSAVIMRYYEGLSAREIGASLGLSPAAVDMRLSRARAQLKGLLAPLMEPEETPLRLGKAVGDQT